ncbi:hypothetical protein [Mesorhizobium sp.]|uniref:hypothetical protein n=1 Tax=Mesorhizobium sp. TaxID=1871066 RepID=UPI00257B108A|nr:hypothetical protein [Mesorhizobium sp.]
MMNADEMQAVADAYPVVTPDMASRQLIKAARNPNASKKEIARAAFFSIVALSVSMVPIDR